MISYACVFHSSRNKLSFIRTHYKPKESTIFDNILLNSEWPKGEVKSSRLTNANLAYLLSEVPPESIYQEFDGVSMHMATGSVLAIN